MSISWPNRPHKCIISHMCAKRKNILRVRMLCIRYHRQGILPVPNDEDYNLDLDTYDGEFFQEDGLEGRFEIDLTEAIGMDVDIEMVVDEEEDEVQNENDLVILEGNVINDKLAPSDGVDYEMVDSDDESYDPANPDTYEDYF
jgi:hypothetical protein